MKSVAIASALLASLALAAPLDRRAYATKTHTVVQTVMVYTTVWDNQEATPAPAPTSSPALFFEHHPSSSAAAVTSAEVVSSSAPAPVVPSSSPKPEPSSSTPEPVVETPSPAPEPSTPAPTPTPAPEPSPEPTPTPSPEPSPSPAPTPSEPAPAPSSSAPAPAEPTPSQPSTGGGEQYAGSLTMNYYQGGLGACGEPIQDTEMVAALAVDGFGISTYDTATGNPTNKWCNQKIRVSYGGKTADAVIKDRCSGCTGAGGLDATPALWEALTGGQGGASGDRLNSGMTFTLIN